jgi:hypothetical protein
MKTKGNDHRDSIMKRKIDFKLAAAILLMTFPAAARAATDTSTAASPAVTPLAGDTIVAIDKACLPVLRGAKTQATIKAAGFRLQDGAWTMSAQSQPTVQLDPPDAANPHLCTLTLTYKPGGGTALRAALGAWAGAQSPPLAPVETNQAVAGSTDGLTTSTWSGPASGGVEGVVLSQEKPAAGGGGLNQATVFVSLSPA